jgi:hypothetical protein
MVRDRNAGLRLSLDCARDDNGEDRGKIAGWPMTTKR